MKLNVVPARTGVLWVRLGMQTFLRQPLALAGLFFMYMAAVLVISQLPLIGPVVGGMLVPAATLGLMAATAEAHKGKFPMPSILISAFKAGRQRVRSMLILGAIYTAGSILASGLASLIAGPPSNELGRPDGSTLLALLLHVPLFMMFWHAPALVHWHGVQPAQALFFSVVAVMRNFGALVVYGLGWVLLFMGIGSVLGLLGGLLGGPALAQTLIVPAALMLAAMFSTSIWFTFRDSFSDSQAADEAQPAALPGDRP